MRGIIKIYSLGFLDLRQRHYSCDTNMTLWADTHHSSLTRGFLMKIQYMVVQWLANPESVVVNRIQPHGPSPAQGFFLLKKTLFFFLSPRLLVGGQALGFGKVP